MYVDKKDVHIFYCLIIGQYFVFRHIDSIYLIELLSAKHVQGVNITEDMVIVMTVVF